MNKKKQAMVFAAGLGSRLRPLTNDIPKVLVKLNQKEILGLILDKLLANGFEKIVVNTHYFADKVSAFIKKNYSDKNIAISFEEDLLETGGGLIKAKDYFEDGPILIHNGDILSDIDLNFVWEEHIKSESIASLVCFDRKSSREFIWNKDNQLIGWRNNMTNEYKWSRNEDDYFVNAFAAVHVIEKETIEKLGNIRKFSITESYLDFAKTKKITRIEYNPSYWFDIGSLESLKNAEEFLSKLERNS